MKCPRCGSEINNGAPFCPRCGTTLQGAPNQPPNQFSQKTPNNGGKKNNTALIITLISIGAVVFIIAFAFSFMAMAKVGPFEPKPTPTPIPTASPSPVPAPTQPPAPTPQVIVVTQPPSNSSNSSASSSSGAVSNPKYLTYSSSKYPYSIYYPSHFVAYDDGLGEATLYTVKSPDGSAREIVAASPIGGNTVSGGLNSYISEHSGSVSYKTSGADYYAVNIKSGSMEYYKYCKFKDGNMYWFEFISPASQHDVYDRYINDIYKSISIN